jgi:hypothetical protein
MNTDVLPRARRIFYLTALCLALFASHDAFSQTITVANKSVSTIVPGISTTAVYVLANNGDIITSIANANSTADVGDWLAPKSGMSGFQVRATSSTCIGPAVNVWLSLGTSQAWHITANPPVSSASCTATLEISAVANPSVILASWWISLYAAR